MKDEGLFGRRGRRVEKGGGREGGEGGCCNTVTYSTGEEPWLWMEREQIIRELLFKLTIFIN